MKAATIGNIIIGVSVVILLTGLILLYNSNIPPKTQEVKAPVKTPAVSAAQVNLAPAKPTPKMKLRMPANALFKTGILVRKGQLVETSATGKVNTLPEKHNDDGSYRWVGPDGWGSENPGFITKAGGLLLGPLPIGASYLALAARVSPSAPSLTDGRWIQVGSNGSFVADQGGYLYLIVNEKIQDQTGVLHPEWLSNNQGALNVEVNIQ